MTARARLGSVPIAAGRLLRRVRSWRSADDRRLGLVGHLGELRVRLGIAAASVFVAFIGTFAVHGWLLEQLNEPLGGAQPVTLGVAEPFMTAVRISFMAAMAVALPVLLWQIWSFVAPACERHVRRTVLGFVAAGAMLFVAGAALGYFVALPQAIGFLVGFDAELYDVQVRAQEYYTFAAAVLLSVGLVFQLPVVLLGLVRFQVLSHSMLVRHRRIAYVSLCALAVLMPGVDPVTTSMWIVPLFVLFEGTILVARRYERRLERAGLAGGDGAAAAQHDRTEDDDQDEDDDADVADIERRLGLRT